MPHISMYECESVGSRTIQLDRCQCHEFSKKRTGNSLLRNGTEFVAKLYVGYYCCCTAVYVHMHDSLSHAVRLKCLHP